jgi:hypothetical protein
MTVANLAPPVIAGSASECITWAKYELVLYPEDIRADWKGSRFLGVGFIAKSALSCRDGGRPVSARR